MQERYMWVRDENNELRSFRWYFINVYMCDRLRFIERFIVLVQYICALLFMKIFPIDRQ